MFDESDLQREKTWHYELLAKKCVAALLHNNINACYVSTRDQARQKAIELIPEGATIGMGDSVTLHQTGIIEELTESGRYTVFNPLLRDEEGELVCDASELPAMMRKASMADVFLMVGQLAYMFGEEQLLAAVEAKVTKLEGMLKDGC